MTSSGFVALVVEDDVLTRMDIAGAFVARGWAVLEAASGEAALALCNSGTRVDALITDIDLGGGASGWDVACAFWQRGVLPVIYVSASTDLPHRRVLQSRFMAKPCRPSALIEACAHLHESFRRQNCGGHAGRNEAVGPA
ncbi:MAG: response regulator [Alphaproteobacteria bacterium]|nr:MAG: response regulator [Alphaproteobacteria bacterium]